MWPPVLATPQTRAALTSLVGASVHGLLASQIHRLDLQGGTGLAIGSLTVNASPAVVIGAEAVDLEFKREVFRVSASVAGDAHHWSGPGTGPKPRWESLLGNDELDVNWFIGLPLSVSAVRDTTPASFEDEPSASVMIEGALLLEASSGERLLLDAQIDRYPGLLPTWFMATTDRTLIAARLDDAELITLLDR